MKTKRTSFSIADVVVVVVDCHCRFSICRSSEITRGEEAAVLAVVIAEVSSLFFFSLSLDFCLPLGFLPLFFSLALCPVRSANSKERTTMEEREKEGKGGKNRPRESGK